MRRAEIEDALDRLAQMHDQLNSLSTSGISGWEKDYLRLRRTLQEQITRLSQADADLNLSDDDKRLFRDSFGKFRSVTALHQADWPVVNIDRQDPGYRQSAVNVGQAYQNFMKVMRKLLDQCPRGACANKR